MSEKKKNIVNGAIGKQIRECKVNDILIILQRWIFCRKHLSSSTLHSIMWLPRPAATSLFFDHSVDNKTQSNMGAHYQAPNECHHK